MKNSFKVNISFWFPVLLLGLGVSACNKNNDTRGLIGYSESAERWFQRAMDEFNDEDCVSAEPLFESVRRKFPYSRYSTLSELRIADCQFIQGNHAEAAVSYGEFVKAHPTHEEAHYSAFRRSLCYYEMIPGDWVVTPPPHERDQAATRDARDAFRQFLVDYPKSEHHKRAGELLQDVEDALVRHEMYVANFYITRDDKRAAVVRLEGIREQFPKSSLVPDAMFLQALTFVELNDYGEAKRIFGDIINYFPKHYQCLRAKDYLRHLQSVRGGEKRGDNG